MRFIIVLCCPNTISYCIVIRSSENHFLIWFLVP